MAVSLFAPLDGGVTVPDENRPQRPGKAHKTVVFALYDKVTLQDVAAPLEIFARANDFGARYDVVLASLDGKAVETTSYVTLNVDTCLLYTSPSPRDS